MKCSVIVTPASGYVGSTNAGSRSRKSIRRMESICQTLRFHLNNQGYGQTGLLNKFRFLEHQSETGHHETKTAFSFVGLFISRSF